MENILKVDRDNPDPDLLKLAADWIHQGMAVAFPTETFYGLGVDVFQPSAVERLYQIKKRDRVKPLIVLVAEDRQVSDLTESVPRLARSLMDRFWPGPLTLVLRASSRVPDSVTGGTGKIGIRIPGDPLTRLFLQVISTPLTATSANRSGRPSPTTAQQVWHDLAGNIQGILDAGQTPGGLPSTVVDVTEEPGVILRAGRVPVHALDLPTNSPAPPIPS